MQQHVLSARPSKKVCEHCRSYLEGWEGHDGLVHVLIVGGQVLGPVQHLGGVVYQGLLGREGVWQGWLLQRVHGRSSGAGG